MLDKPDPLLLLLAAIGLVQVVIAVAAVSLAVSLKRLHSVASSQAEHPFYDSPGVLSHEAVMKLSQDERARLMEQSLAEYGDGEHGTA